MCFEYAKMYSLCILLYCQIFFELTYFKRDIFVRSTFFAFSSIYGYGSSNATLDIFLKTFQMIKIDLLWYLTKGCGHM